MLGVISPKPTSIRYYALDAECSLFRQSYVNANKLQGDGWGIAFYSDGGLKVIKSTRPVYEEGDLFRSAVGAEANITIAHVRRASNPRKLPKDLLLTPECIQPFVYKNYAFAHNGTITAVDEVRGLLGDYGEMVKGLNDSEVYFWHLVKMLEEGMGLEESVTAFRGILTEVWEEVKGLEKYSDVKGPAVGLNIIFSDGHKLYAACVYDGYDAGTALCLQDQPYFEMAYMATNAELVVASEKLFRDGRWMPLRDGQLLVAEVVDGSVKHEVVDLRPPLLARTSRP